MFIGFAHIRDEKTAGTTGGTFTSGAWRTRDINTEKYDPLGIVSISSNQFTIVAGSYYIDASAPAYNVYRHRIKLRNITDSTDDILGTSEYASASTNGYNHSTARGYLTLGASKTFEIQHRCESSQATYGFGVEGNFSITEVYTEVFIWKLATSTKITAMSAKTSVEDTDLIVIVDNDDSLNKKVAASDLKTYVNAP
jgi:hypothetical protein